MNNKEINKRLDAIAVVHTTASDLVGQMASMAEDLAGELRDYYDERSEKWQEGEAGQAIESLISELDGFVANLCLENIPDF